MRFAMPATCLAVASLLVAATPIPAAAGDCMKLCNRFWGGTATAEKVAHEVDKGADVNGRDEDLNTPLILVALKGRNSRAVGAMRALILAGAEVNTHNNQGMTPLHAATLSRVPLEMVQLLLENGADVNARSDRGWTPLVVAAGECKDPKVIPALIKAGAQPMAVDFTYNNAFHALVVMHNDTPGMIKALVEAKVDINAKNDIGWTALHVAVTIREPSLETIGVLIANGADVNARDNQGYTPLHLVAQTGSSKELIEFLVQKGADTTAKTPAGKTALELARENLALAEFFR